MFARLHSLAIKLLVGLIVLHLLITGLGRPAEAATRTTVDGVTHVRNGDEPRDGRRTVALHELWRIGGDDEETLFGRIPRVAAGPDGNVYVLDSQLCEVSVYDRDGALIRSLFREGEGPGEVREPRDMFVLGDGRVGLIQDFPGVVVMVDAQGNPAGRITVGGTDGGIHSLTSCQARGDVLLLAGTHHDNSRPGISGRDFFLERYSPDGDFVARYGQSYAEYDFSDFVFAERQHLPPFWFSQAVTADGTVYACHDRDRYAITVHAPDGTPQHVIERDYAPLQRTDLEYQAFEGMIRSALGSMPFPFTIDVERQESAIAVLARGLQIGPDGRLWVLSGRGSHPAAEGVMAVWDVFDADGSLAEQVALAAPHHATEVGIFLTADERVLVVEGYFESLAAQFGGGGTYAPEGQEVAPPAVICYEMVR